jgi:hypothetical protein
LEDPPPPRHHQPPVVHYPPPAYYPPPSIVCHDYVDGEWRLTERGRRYWHTFRHPREVQVPCR